MQESLNGSGSSNALKNAKPFLTKTKVGDVVNDFVDVDVEENELSDAEKFVRCITIYRYDETIDRIEQKLKDCIEAKRFYLIGGARAYAGRCLLCTSRAVKKKSKEKGALDVDMSNFTVELHDLSLELMKPAFAEYEHAKIDFEMQEAA